MLLACIGKSKQMLSNIAFESLVNPTLSIYKLRDLFCKTTGLDFFIFCKDELTGYCEEKTFCETVKLPSLCALLRTITEGSHTCSISHEKMMHKSLEKGGPLCLSCHAGLLTVHYPIKINGQVKGNIQTVCALRYKDRGNLVPLAKRISQQYSLPYDSVFSALKSLPVITKKKEIQIKEWLELIACFLVDQSRSRFPEVESIQFEPTSAKLQQHTIEYNIRLALESSVALPPWRGNRSTGGSSQIISLVKEYLDQNYHLPLSAKIISQALGFEQSYFVKMFKKYSDDSLPNYIRNLRITRANHLLIHQPFLSIQEVCHKVGFKNHAYFSRVFQQVMGTPPSHIRDM